jgi:hypothetical protein
MPEWVIEILKGLGGAGAVIFVLMLTVTGLVAYVKSLHAKADKVYGYRLAERDTYNKTLTDTAKVLEGIIRVSEERNQINEEQADLILKQSHALDLLKTSVVSQYDNIRDHNSASSQTVGALAEAVRSLTMMVAENRNIAQAHVNAVNKSIGEMGTDVSKAITTASQSQMVEMRSLLGHVTTIHRRRKSPK